MLKHIVLYKLEDNSKESRLALVDKFMSMKGKIDVLVDIASGEDIIKSERSFDVALICTFKDREALEQYAVHPVHLPVKAYVQNVIRQAHSVDFLY